MLYKKYHRNYVSQFKKKTKFILKGSSNNYNNNREVIVEPYINRNWCEVQMTSTRNTWTLVYPGGQLNTDIIVDI